MRIKLFDDYKSAAGLFIPRGEYSSEDPVLQGQAKYLVESKHAVWVAELVSTEGAEESATIEEQSEETVIGGESVPGVTEETSSGVFLDDFVAVALTPVPMTDMTKDELIELAAERGIDLGPNPKRNKPIKEIVDLIRASTGGDA